MRRPFKKSISDIAKEPAHGGSGQRQMLLGLDDDISSKLEAATKAYLASGDVFDWHGHEDIDEFFVVMKGAGLVTYKNGDSFPYEEGDVIYTPANLKHKIENTGDCESEFLFVRVIV